MNLHSLDDDVDDICHPSFVPPAYVVALLVPVDNGSVSASRSGEDAAGRGIELGVGFEEWRERLGEDVGEEGVAVRPSEDNLARFWDKNDELGSEQREEKVSDGPWADELAAEVEKPSQRSTFVKRPNVRISRLRSSNSSTGGFRFGF